MEIRYGIERKSTGFLIDEMITAEFKIEAGNEAARERRHQLGNAVTERIGLRQLIPGFNKTLHGLMDELRIVLRECWDAQELIMYYGEISAYTRSDIVLAVAEAGKTAQRTNGRRNQLIRKIDDLFDEADITQLEKTYYGV